MYALLNYQKPPQNIGRLLKRKRKKQEHKKYHIEGNLQSWKAIHDDIIINIASLPIQIPLDNKEMKSSLKFRTSVNHKWLGYCANVCYRDVWNHPVADEPGKALFINPWRELPIPAPTASAKYCACRYFTSKRSFKHYPEKLMTWKVREGSREPGKTTSWMVFFRSKASLTRLSKNFHVSPKSAKDRCATKMNYFV